MMNADTRKLAAKIRADAIRMVAQARGSHLGGALSMADILAVLYGSVLRFDPEDPKWHERDRFILSKGHCCSILYATLASVGFFSPAELDSYGTNGSRLLSHVSHKVPGVEFSTGSLGHGLPFGCGRALAAKKKGEQWRTYVMLGDGEMDEGSNWEAALFAPQHRLDGLCAIVDYNRIQSLGNVGDVLELEPLADKFRAFRWEVREIDGHDHDALTGALSALPWQQGKPSALIARTIKGKGIDFMENTLKWHYASPNAAELESALRQLGSH